MSNKHPQYLTPNGFIRQKSKPSTKRVRRRVLSSSEVVNSDLSELTLSTKIAKRVITKRAKRRAHYNDKGERILSPQAAKAIAAALSGLLNS